MKQTDITSHDFLVWWQNRFPNLACIAAPYARILISRSLRPESYFTLRVAYLITRLRQYDPDDPDCTDLTEQLDWLSPESRKELLEDLSVLSMDALVKHLRESPYAVIPNHALWPVVESLNSRIDKYFDSHRAILIDDMESVTGKTLDELPKRICISAPASEVVKHLLLPCVVSFMRFIENADAELSSIKEQLLTPDSPVDPLAKRRYLDFRIDVNRHLKSFDMQIPEIAEEWLYHVFELIEEHPNYFGK